MRTALILGVSQLSRCPPPAGRWRRAPAVGKAGDAVCPSDPRGNGPGRPIRRRGAPRRRPSRACWSALPLAPDAHGQATRPTAMYSRCPRLTQSETGTRLTVLHGARVMSPGSSGKGLMRSLSNRREKVQLSCIVQRLKQSSQLATTLLFITPVLVGHVLWQRGACTSDRGAWSSPARRAPVANWLYASQTVTS